MNSKPYMNLEKDTSLTPDALVDAQEASFDLVSVLHGRIAEEYSNLNDRLKTISEFDLCEEVDPTPSDYKMRQNFTDAVAVARASGKKVRTSSIYEDVITKQTFFDYYVKNPLKIAFIMRPVVPHHAYYDAVFKEGLRKMFLFVRKYDLDPKNMSTFMRIVEKAGDRVIGPVVQRIAMHQKQEVTHTSSTREVNAEDPIELEAKVREMTAKLAKMKPLEIEAKSADDED